jgi:hypothetical protein
LTEDMRPEAFRMSDEAHSRRFDTPSALMGHEGMPLISNLEKAGLETRGEWSSRFPCCTLDQML